MNTPHDIVDDIIYEENTIMKILKIKCLVEIILITPTTMVVLCKLMALLYYNKISVLYGLLVSVIAFILTFVIVIINKIEIKIARKILKL